MDDLGPLPLKEDPHPPGQPCRPPAGRKRSKVDDPAPGKLRGDCLQGGRA